ncbi:MAG: hypothetical protein U0798_06635 [Gemmataceae bacterium]
MRTIAIALLILVFAPAVFAGMPAPLPDQPERVLHLGESPMARLQTLSFFLLVFLLSSAAFMLLWNYVRRDLTFLPRITFGRATAGVFLWGLLFVVVLTMISGARELMTPGAWRKQGFTYQLTPTPTPETKANSFETDRREHLEKLRTALLMFAAKHGGAFPQPYERDAIAADLWLMPNRGNLPYLYRPGLTARDRPALLVIEPELNSQRRLVLKTTGEITEMTSDEIQSLTVAEKSP